MNFSNLFFQPSSIFNLQCYFISIFISIYAKTCTQIRSMFSKDIFEIFETWKILIYCIRNLHGTIPCKPANFRITRNLTLIPNQTILEPIYSIEKRTGQILIKTCVRLSNSKCHFKSNERRKVHKLLTNNRFHLLEQIFLTMGALTDEKFN